MKPDYTLVAPFHFYKESKPKKGDFQCHVCGGFGEHTSDCGSLTMDSIGKQYQKAIQEWKAKYDEPNPDDYVIGLNPYTEDYEYNEELYKNDVDYYNYHKVKFPRCIPESASNDSFRLNFSDEVMARIEFFDTNRTHFEIYYLGERIEYCESDCLTIERLELILKENGI